MAADLFIVERHGSYATFTLNRPEKRNSLNASMLKSLDEAVASVEDNKGIRAVILRGNGRDFCSGIDLAEVERTEGGHNPVNLEKIFKRLEHLPVPIVSAVQGAALAGGCELALHCDLRVAADNARMGMPVARVGLVVPYNFIRKLIEIIGAANTAQILYTAEPVDAQRALQMGMVHEVVPAAKLDEAAVAWAEKVASNAPLSLRTMKMSMRRSLDESNDAWHEDILAMARMVRSSQDAKEGVRAFLEKRKPVWRAE